MNRSKKMSVFGGTGFIGKKYCELYSDSCIIIPREQKKPESHNILYFISTIDNYNVFSDLHLDIDTNLTALIDRLSSIDDEDRSKTVFNFISSWFVYGDIHSLPAKESYGCNPKGFYSITKRAAEQLLVSYCNAFRISYRIIRLCNVYGVGDNKASKKRNALQYLTFEVVNNRDINLYNSGTDIRDFMYVDDVCRAINCIVNSELVNDVINVGTGIPHRFIDMMNYVKTKTDSTSKFNSIHPPAFHKAVQVKDMYLDISKLDSLGFSTDIRIEDGLNMLIDKAYQYYG